MTEEWKDIPGYEGRYQASTHGRVRSLDRTIYRKHAHGGYATWDYKGRVLRQGLRKDGHLNVNLGEYNTKKVHRLVLETFVGPCPQGKECLHKDGMPENNRLDNLHWGTRLANRADMRVHAQLYRRVQGSTWLSKDTILAIKRDLRDPKPPSQRVLAQKYGTHRNTINNINRGFTHKWIEP
jgi:hypothetical protein